MPEASKTVMIDHQMEVEELEREKAISSSPDHEDLVPVRINSKTVIFARPGEDPEKKRQEFLAKLAARDNAQKKSMNDKKIHYN